MSMIGGGGLFNQGSQNNNPLQGTTPRANFTNTSQDGAAIDEPEANDKARMIITVLQDAGRDGLSNSQIEHRSGVVLSTVCSITNRLWETGRIVSLKQRRVNQETNKPVKVWVLREHIDGREYEPFTTGQGIAKRDQIIETLREFIIDHGLEPPC